MQECLAYDSPEISQKKAYERGLEMLSSSKKEINLIQDKDLILVVKQKLVTFYSFTN